jgi:hypothetical protein
VNLAPSFQEILKVQEVQTCPPEFTTKGQSPSLGVMNELLHLKNIPLQMKMYPSVEHIPLSVQNIPLEKNAGKV